MKIDQYSCVVMEKDGWPGDIGDACAETGRFVIFGGDPKRISLRKFFTEAGFTRHPTAPEGWRESDFTSDQMTYLLMATHLIDRELFDWARTWMPYMTKFKTPDVYALKWESFHLLGLLAVFQMLINKIPWRWHDGEDGTENWGWFRKKFWRFKSSEGSYVSYLTVFTAVVFLKRVGIVWPQKFMDREKYQVKATLYYCNVERGEPNTDWFVELLGSSLT